MKKWLIIIFVVVIIIGSAIYFLHHKKQIPATTTVKVTKGDITEKAQAVGYIKPRHSITIKSQIAGTVAKIYHDEGDYVNKGELLIEIKPAPSPTEYAQAEEELAETAATEKTAASDINRYQTALKLGYITRHYTDYIAAKRSFLTAKLKHGLAAQKLELLKQGKAVVAGQSIANVIKSPINGYILNRAVDVGDPVISLSSAQASTTLFSIANMKDLMFEGSVDEMDAAKIHLGMPAKIIVGALPQIHITGEITKIGLQSEQQQGDSSEDKTSPFNVGFKVQITKLEFPKNITLRAGYSATADINIKTANNALVLPMRVIHFQDSQPYVLLPAKNNKPPKQQSIKLGISDGINVQILQGLTEGEQVLDQNQEANNDTDS